MRVESSRVKQLGKYTTRQIIAMIMFTSIARQGLYLPSGLTLTEAQLDQVCNAVLTEREIQRNKGISKVRYKIEWKDYVDIYILLRDHFSLAQISEKSKDPSSLSLKKR